MEQVDKVPERVPEDFCHDENAVDKKISTLTSTMVPFTTMKSIQEDDDSDCNSYHSSKYNLAPTDTMQVGINGSFEN